MVKVFIGGLDTPYGYNLGNLLSRSFVEKRDEPAEPEEEPPAEDEAPPADAPPAEKAPKEPYTVVGSLQPAVVPNLFLHTPTKTFTKPGKMIESGDRKKDASRREAIEKIPNIGVKPSFASESVFASDRDGALKLMLESDIIIYDAMLDINDCEWAIETVAKYIDNFEKPKTFVLISTVMTWAKTKPADADDPESSISEDEYRRRKCHPNFKEHFALEKLIAKYSKKEKFKGYVIAAGLVYHAGDSLFHSYMKAAWHNEPALNCYGDGTNILPCIHLDDLITLTLEVIDSSPEQRYILGVDDSKNSLYEITKAIADNLSNGIVKKVNKEDAFVEKSITQADYDMLTVNLRLEPVFLKEAGLELKYESGFVESMPQVVQEYKDARGLWPIKIVIHGPPASGKTTVAQKIAEHYKIHYLEPDEIVAQALVNLEARVNRPPPTGEDEEVDIEADKEALNELRENLKANNGKLTAAQAIPFVRDKIRSMECRNQGYVLDGCPQSVEEANEIFKPQDDDVREDRITPVVDDQIAPEFVFSLDISDIAIKQRIMKLPEAPTLGSKNSEEVLTKRLEEFRKINTDDLTVLNFFDELEITPSILQLEIIDSTQMYQQIFEEIGEPRNYGKSPEQLAQEQMEAEKKRIEDEALMAQERERREREEADRYAKAQEDWKIKLEKVKKQEQEVLESQSSPLRSYLTKYVMPTLTAGLIEVAKVRPDDPIDYLAEYLFKHNASNN